MARFRPKRINKINKLNMSKLNKADQFAADILRTRGLDFPRIGMMIEVNGQRGTIQGMNRSANLDVVFVNQLKMGDHEHNCHPTWETCYFDVDGNIIRDFRTKEVGGSAIVGARIG